MVREVWGGGLSEGGIGRLGEVSGQGFGMGDKGLGWIENVKLVACVVRNLRMLERRMVGFLIVGVIKRWDQILGWYFV